LDVLKDLKIPVLPMNHQDKIVNKVQNLHEKAKDLKIEANKIYEDSKKEVEKMILGDDL
jgi:restriction endonuclease S subunit